MAPRKNNKRQAKPADAPDTEPNESSLGEEIKQPPTNTQARLTRDDR